MHIYIYTVVYAYRYTYIHVYLHIHIYIYICVCVCLIYHPKLLVRYTQLNPPMGPQIDRWILHFHQSLPKGVCFTRLR